MSLNYKSKSDISWTEIIIMIPISIVLLITEGWLISTLWNWFMVPILSSCTLSIVHAIGLSILVKTVTGTNNIGALLHDAKKGQGNFKKGYLFELTWSNLRVQAVEIGIGYIAYLFFI